MFSAAGLNTILGSVGVFRIDNNGIYSEEKRISCGFQEHKYAKTQYLWLLRGSLVFVCLVYFAFCH